MRPLKLSERPRPVIAFPSIEPQDITGEEKTKMKAKSNLLAVTIFLTALINALAQPTITRQPTNQSVGLAANVSFKVI